MPLQELWAGDVLIAVHLEMIYLLFLSARSPAGVLGSCFPVDWFLTPVLGFMCKSPGIRKFTELPEIQQITAG